MDPTTEMIAVLIGIIWGLHLMTRAQDYKRIKERFQRASDPMLVEKYGRRESVLKFLGLLLTAASLFYLYDIMYNR